MPRAAPGSGAFLEALPPEQQPRFRQLPDLDERLGALLESGRHAWPNLDVSPEAFYRQLGAGVPDDLAADSGDALDAIHAPDLYLACACAAGSARAIEALERHTFNVIEAAAHRMRASSSVVDEARQIVRKEVLLAREGKPPGIARFSGRGDLRGWIRVTAVRQILRLLRSTDKEQELEDDALYEMLTPVDDLEIEHFKRVYRGEFSAALQDAIRELPRKERTVLRYQAIDGLSIDEVGAIYGVHRATAARWAARAREALLIGTRHALMRRLRISEAEVDSVLRLVQSRLDLSLERFLQVTRP
jgi:RNA polymerase sigma-70 factor, ECF subfamily